MSSHIKLSSSLIGLDLSVTMNWKPFVKQLVTAILSRVARSSVTTPQLIILSSLPKVSLTSSVLCVKLVLRLVYLSFMRECGNNDVWTSVDVPRSCEV